MFAIKILLRFTIKLLNAMLLLHMYVKPEPATRRSIVLKKFPFEYVLSNKLLPEKLAARKKLVFFLTFLALNVDST